MAAAGQHLLIRADAATAIGTGHVMRCLALSQAWQDAGGAVTLAAALLPEPLERRLRAEGVGVERLAVELGGADDAQAAARLARRLGARWVVADGYHFSGDYQRAVQESGLRVLAVDDYGHADHYWADAVLNQNVHAHEGLYARRAPSVRLLLGTDYALLRREFAPWGGWERATPGVAAKVLVTLGGADPENATLKVLQALKLVRRPLEVVALVGGGNPHLPALRDAAGPGVRLETDVPEMAARIAWADVCVAAGGSTNWELAFLGLPALALVLAENQEGLVQGLAERGVVRGLGWHDKVSVEALAAAAEALIADGPARAAMTAAGRRLVDGRGAHRVVEVLGS